MNICCGRPGWLLLLLLSVWPPVLVSAPNAGQADVAQPHALSIEQVEASLAELGDVDKLQDEEKTIHELYQTALKQLIQAQRDDAAAVRYKQAVDDAAKQKALLTKELNKVLDAGKRPLSKKVKKLPLPELELRLDQAQADAKVAQNKLLELQTRLTNEQARPELAADEGAKAKQKLQEIGDELKAAEATGDARQAAWRVSLQATERALRSRLKRLEMERLSQGPRIDQLNLQIDIARERLKQANARVQQLQTLLSQKLNADVQRVHQQAVQVEKASEGKHPLIQAAAETNTQLSARLGEVTARLERRVKEKERLAYSLQQVERNLEQAKQRLDFAGSDEVLGALLRTQRKELPDVRKLRERAVEARRKIAETRLQRFHVEDQKRQLQDYLDRLEQRPADVDEAAWPSLKAALEKLYNNQLELLNKLLATLGRYDKVLGDLALEREQMVSRVESYSDLLDKNLMWIPSAQPLNKAMLLESTLAVLRLSDPKLWLQAGQRFYVGVMRQPLALASSLLFVLFLLVIRPRLRRRLEAMVPRVGNVSHDSFLLTVRAFLLTLLLAAPPVLLLLSIGLILKLDGDSTFAGSGRYFLQAASFYGLIQLSRYLFIQNGLAEVHFRWRTATLNRSRRYLNLFLFYSIPLALASGVAELQDDVDFRQNLLRVLELALAVGIGFFAHLAFNPWHGITAIRERRWNWSLLLYVLLIGISIFLVVLEIRGYNYSSIQLFRMIFLSTWVLLLAVLLYSTAERWLLVAERRLALAKARAKRLAAQEARAAKEAAEAAGESVHDLPELEEINISAINQQTRRLLRLVAALVMLAGLVLVWYQLMPAVSRLDEIVLWDYQVGSGASQELVPVSVWDLLVDLLVILLTVVAARNLPGLLEIALLQPLRLDPGSRYAFSRILNYMIYGAGALIALKVLGIRWDDIQWLVAAMGVGLGFGLQEIFANFISGLMILFERPIRIGDTVTVGNVSGTVSRIRMRATTITDWDNKELVVPNKSFITDPLINWTLSDPITRVVVKVGIAYGSDVELAHRVMMKVACDHPDVLDDPKPTVFFTGFGDSALDFEVRVFVSDRIKRMPLTHDLYTGLNNALSAAGIEIPFPQRDLHLRSVDPGVRFSDAPPNGAPG